MLRRIALENFKNWQRLEVELAPITLLFGTNSAGKTSILQSLLLLKQTARGFDPKQHINFGGGERDYADFGSYSDLVYAHDQSNCMGIGLSWEIRGGHGSFFELSREDSDNTTPSEYDANETLNYYIRWNADGDINIDRLEYSATVRGDTEYFISAEQFEQGKYKYDLSESFFDTSKRNDEFEMAESDSEEEPVETPGSCYRIPISVFKLRDIRRFKTPPFYFNFEFERLMDSLYYLGPLRQYPRRYYQWTGDLKTEVVEPDGADTIKTLVSSERDDKSLQKHVAEWMGRLELVQALKVKATDRNKRFYEVTVNVDGVDSALVDVGFGVSQVLPVVTLLFSAPSGATLLLEQPELHLHPNAQSLLADLLLFVAEKRDIQLIVESHSEHMLRRLQRRIAEAELQFATHDNVRAYFCVPTDTGSDISEVELDRFGQIANWPDKFLGDISGDLHTMAKAAIRRRRQELASE